MVYGDSIGVHYYRLATNRPLCKEIFRTCSKKYMWTYDVSWKILMSFLSIVSSFWNSGKERMLEQEKENIINLNQSKNEWNYRNFKRLDTFQNNKIVKKSMSVLRNYDANHSTMIYDDDRTWSGKTIQISRKRYPAVLLPCYIKCSYNEHRLMKIIHPFDWPRAHYVTCK